MKHFDLIIVGGFGHVGLPLGIVLADSGLNVGLLDIDHSKRPMIEAGQMPFIEYDSEPLLKKVIGKTLHVCDGIEDCKNADAVLICIGTPVDEYMSPKLRPLFALVDTLAPHLNDGQLVILRSTVFPGTSKSLFEHLKIKGRTVELAFCPERIAQGYAIRELKTLPQIVAGTNESAIARARKIFERLKVEVIPVELEEAELTKLFLNAWRYIQFAVGNQFYMMATEYGFDYSRIYDAMTKGYERGRIPRPGFAAGPCLLKDTMQLAAFYRNQFVLGQGAMMVNEGLPGFIVEQLRQKNVKLRGANVGVLGMTFKADIDDTRDSLSFKLCKLIRFHGANVICSDEFVKNPEYVTKEELVKKCPVVIVGVPHSAYRSLTLPASATVLDLWDVLPKRA